MDCPAITRWPSCWPGDSAYEHRWPFLPYTRQLLAWAGEHKAATGRWPKRNSGPVLGHPGETWVAVNAALESGARGLPGGSSLAQLLDEHHGVPNKSQLPRLTVPMILGFADAWHRRTREWPTSLSGAIPEMPGLTWRAVNMALHQGLRGLPGGGSLHLLLTPAARRFPSGDHRRSRHDEWH